MLPCASPRACTTDEAAITTQPLSVSEPDGALTQPAQANQVIPDMHFTSFSPHYGYLEEAAITTQPLLVSEADEPPAQLTLANEQVMPGMDLTSYLPGHDHLEETDITTQLLLVSEADKAPSQLALADEVMPEMLRSSSLTDDSYLEEADEGKTIRLDTNEVDRANRPKLHCPFIGCKYAPGKKWFKSDITRKRHIGAIHKKSRNLCTTAGCVHSKPGFGFAYRTALWQHEFTEHNGAAPPHKCPHCTLAFWNEVKLKLHAWSHATEEEYDLQPEQCCPFCQMALTKDTVVHHILYTHCSTPRFMCPAPGCAYSGPGRAFDKYSRFQSHVKLHDPHVKDVIRCPYDSCLQTMAGSAASRVFIKHIDKEHKERIEPKGEFLCAYGQCPYSVAGSGFDSRYNLKRHIRYHLDRTDKQLADNDYVNSAVTEEGEERRSIEIFTIRSDEWLCPVPNCKRSRRPFPNRWQLLRHARGHDKKTDKGCEWRCNHLGCQCFGSVEEHARHISKHWPRQMCPYSQCEVNTDLESGMVHHLRKWHQTGDGTKITCSYDGCTATTTLTAISEHVLDTHRVEFEGKLNAFRRRLSDHQPNAF